MTCRELNDAKPVLINGKLVNLLAAINLNKINSWEHIKIKSLWVIVNFHSLEEVKKQFILFFIDRTNNAITFNKGEKKLAYYILRLMCF